MPNIIFILSDDIGYADIAAYRRHLNLPEIVPTPHLDNMARNGMMFTDAYTPAGLCAPTRYGTITGNYCFRGLKQWGAWSAHEPVNLIVNGFKQKTVADAAREGGYHTAFFGKLHLGGDWYKTGTNEIYTGHMWNDPDVDIARGYASNGPTDYGFDYSLVLPSGIQHSPYAYYENDQWMPIAGDSVIIRTPDLQKDSNWASEPVGAFLAQKAVDFIDDHLANHSGQPFFIYYCSQAIHTPHTPPDFYDDDPSIPVKGVTGIGNHTDMIYELDLQVGEIITKLRDAGIEKDTLVFFTSDNGGWDHSGTLAAGHDSNGKLRGKKGDIYEGGCRVPLIAQWADTQTGESIIDPNSKSSQLVCTIDLMATIYNLTGRPMEPNHACDSVSLLPVLVGEQSESQPLRDSLVTQGRDHASNDRMAIRESGWKLIINHTNRTPIELIHLAEDMNETTNLINEPTQQARVMHMMNLFNEIYGHSEHTTARVAYSVPGCVMDSSQDANGDCIIDISDLTTLVEQWLNGL